MNYNFSDVIKNKFLEEFSSVSIGEVLLALALSFVLALFVVFVYKLTYQGVLFSRSFAVGLVLLSMLTTLVILTISSNVVLSLGMVGALSIVRFRTAVKDPLDTIFMFWAIVTGIVTGAGYISVAVIATLLIGLLFVLLSMNGKLFSAKSYLVSVRCDAAEPAAPEKVARALPKCRVRSKSLGEMGAELVLEVKLTDAELKKAESIRDIPGVSQLNFIASGGSAVL